jgi:hypothetical protein
VTAARSRSMIKSGPSATASSFKFCGVIGELILLLV